MKSLLRYVAWKSKGWYFCLGKIWMRLLNFLSKIFSFTSAFMFTSSSYLPMAVERWKFFKLWNKNKNKKQRNKQINKATTIQIRKPHTYDLRNIGSLNSQLQIFTTFSPSKCRGFSHEYFLMSVSKQKRFIVHFIE